MTTNFAVQFGRMKDARDKLQRRHLARPILEADHTRLENTDM